MDGAPATAAGKFQLRSKNNEEWLQTNRIHPCQWRFQAEAFLYSWIGRPFGIVPFRGIRVGEEKGESQQRELAKRVVT